MTGGILQLVAYGAQDVYITGNPNITFFKTIYRRHTNFSMETIEDNLDTKPTFGNKTSITIRRHGDLVRRFFLRVVLNPVNLEEGELFAWTNFIGLAMINFVEVEIGGTTLDKQYADWLFIWLVLARPNEHDRGTAKILGFVPELIGYNNRSKPEYTLYVPLPRFSQFIPIIALQYHEVKLHFNFNRARDLIIANDKFLRDGLNRVSIKDATLLTDYIYLDSEERRRMATVAHEYIIQQVQFQGAENANQKLNRYKLNFNHPTKEIIWATINGNYRGGKKFLYYTPLDWKNNLIPASKEILEESICIVDRESLRINKLMCNYDIFFPDSRGQTKNGKINVKNCNNNKVIIINTNSLVIGTYNFIDKICADVILTESNRLIVNILKTDITIRDLSIPVERMTDTRFRRDDPSVNIFGNHGILINGAVNPVKKASIWFNGSQRFEERDGAYFNYVQPDQHHKNTPVDGINTYSFALEPERILATGSANLSRIDDVRLNITFSDPTKRINLPDIGFLNTDNRLIIFAVSFNILRVTSGMAGLAFAT
jgi:hypothetical protein